MNNLILIGYSKYTSVEYGGFYMKRTLNNEKLNYEILQLLYDLNGRDDGDLHWVTANIISTKFKTYPNTDIKNSIAYLHDSERIVCSNRNETSEKDTMKYAITKQGISFIEE